MMLAQQGSIAGMVQEHGEVAAEFKYDGSRFQFHKQGSTGKMYSRRLEEVSAALPDVIGLLLGSTTHDVILDGEVIAIKDERPMPFQSVLRRFRRRHDIAEAQEEIRMVPNVFDILYLDGKTVIDLPFLERRKILVEVVSQYVAPQVISADPQVIEQTYHDALAAGHEGIMIKVPDSAYTRASGEKTGSRSSRRWIHSTLPSSGLNGARGNVPMFLARSLWPARTRENCPPLPGRHRILR